MSAPPGPTPLNVIDWIAPSGARALWFTSDRGLILETLVERVREFDQTLRLHDVLRGRHVAAVLMKNQQRAPPLGVILREFHLRIDGPREKHRPRLGTNRKRAKDPQR